MSADRITIFEQMRPPTAGYNGRSPIRVNKPASSIRLNKNLNQSMDKIRGRGAPAWENYTGEGSQVNEVQWNSRHHVTPSAFNLQNHTYYKQYFDKAQRVSGTILMKPRRMLDPYEMNQVKGTRMPDYSKLYKQRDVYGELGWTPNFMVTFSKNNDNLHPNYKEFFDQPKNYHQQFNNSNLTVSQFFRQNAPDSSVAKEKRSIHRGSSLTKASLHSTIASSAALNDGVAPHHTPFYYNKEEGNTYKYDKRIGYSTIFTNTIPFLRDDESELLIKRDSRNKRRTSCANSMLLTNPSAPSQYKKGLSLLRQKSLKHNKIKEIRWKQLVKPISQINERVHQSQKTTFEQI